MALFVHVPPIAIKPVPKRPLRKPLGERARPGKRKHRAPPRLDDLVRAGEAIVLAMISLRP